MEAGKYCPESRRQEESINALTYGTNKAGDAGNIADKLFGQYKKSPGGTLLHHPKQYESMQKTAFCCWLARRGRRLTTQNLLYMKLTTVLLLTAGLLNVYANGVSQTVTFSGQKVPLKTVFLSVEKQTGFVFLYSGAVLRTAKPVSISASNLPLENFLDKVFLPQPLKYTIRGNSIFVSPRQNADAPAAGETITSTDTLIDVKGKIVDERGSPLAGVYVVEKETGKGTATNEKGEFQLHVPFNAQLQISSVGFENILIKAGLVPSGPVLMKVRAVGLSGAVVIGYGTQQRANVTTSIAAVNSTALTPEKNIVSDIGKALQGRVAGVFVASTNGTPGNTPNILIRGAQSISVTNTNPLFVIDGLVADGGSISLNTINPQDIESIEVLKDAASAAIYGARGSTGVIIITTKRGKQNSKPVFSVNAYAGVNNIPTSRRMLTTDEYASAFQDARNNRIADIDQLLANPVGISPAQISQLKNERAKYNSQLADLKLADRSTDWIDAIKHKNAPINNIQVSMSGGGEKNNYYMSFGRYNEVAAMGTGQFERYTGRLDVTQVVNPWLKINGGIAVNQSANRGVSNPISYAFAARPDMPKDPIFNADGSLGYYVGSQQHPLGVMLDNNNSSKTNTYNGKLVLDITFNKSLQFRSAFNGVKYNTISRTFNSPLYYAGSFQNGAFKLSGTDNFTYNFDNYFTYNKKVSKLDINGTLGYTFYSNDLNALGYDLVGFPRIDGINGASAAGGYGSNFNIANYNLSSDETSDAWFMRGGLAWAGKYLLNASIRRDGSSKLTGDNKYSWFPSVSAGWDIAKEGFLVSNRMINQLKLRGSYGISGNIRPVGFWDTKNLLLSTTYMGVPALQINGIGNPNIHWERTRQIDAGLDAAFLNNRLSLSLDFYNKTTDGLMSRNDISWVYGSSSIPDNIGNIRNQGMDVELTYGSRVASKFTWKISTNLNLNRNKILSLKDSLTNYGALVFGGPGSKAKVGQPVGSVMVYESLGVNPQTGDMMYKDQNKDGKWDANDMITVPVALPKFTGGTTVTLGYKGVTIEALFSYVVGNKVYDYYEQTLRNYDLDAATGVMPNKFDIVNSRWKKPGDITDVPRAITGPHGAGNTADWNYRPSTQFIYDASYVRLRNLMVSYSLPAPILSKVKMNGARLYIAAQNVFTRTKYIGFDPEAVSNTGVVTTNLPNPRATIIGIDLSF